MGVPWTLAGTRCPSTGGQPDDSGVNAIELRGLRKTYGQHAAVDGIDLTVRTGEIIALLGPNGAGKTTTIEILEGHRDRDQGEVSVLGVDPARAGRAWRARIGIVTQQATDAAELTVAELVRHFAGYYPNPRDPATVIDRVGLTGASSARPNWSSWTNRRPGSTRRHAGSSGS